MTTFCVDVTVTQSKLGPVLEAKQSTTKKDSVMLSIFQGIGLLYKIADEVADRQPSYSHVAIDFLNPDCSSFDLIQMPLNYCSVLQIGERECTSPGYWPVVALEQKH